MYTEEGLDKSLANLWFWNDVNVVLTSNLRPS